MIWELFKVSLTRSCPCCHTKQPKLFPLFPVHPSVLIPCPARSSVSSANISHERILVSLAVGLALCWNLWAPGCPLIPFVGEQRRKKKNKVILGSQMKGFEAHEEKCVYLLSLVTSLSPLAKFITGFPWKIHHCPSPAHLVFRWVLLFKHSSACRLPFHPFLSISVVVARGHRSYFLPWLQSPCCPPSLPLASPRTVHPVPQEGPCSLHKCLGGLYSLPSCHLHPR